MQCCGPRITGSFLPATPELYKTSACRIAMLLENLKLKVNIDFPTFQFLK